MRKKQSDNGKKRKRPELPLTAKQEKFCLLVVQLGKKKRTEAIHIAYPGSEKWTSNGATVKAYEMCKQPKIAARIKEIAKNLGIALVAPQREYPTDIQVVEGEQKMIRSSLDILLALENIAFLDIQKLWDEDGNMIPIHKLPKEVAAAIGTINVNITRGKDGKEKLGNINYKIINKKDALELLGKHHKLWDQAGPEPPKEKPMQLTDEVMAMYKITRQKLDILEGKSPKQLDQIKALIDSEEVEIDSVDINPAETLPKT